MTFIRKAKQFKTKFEDTKWTIIIRKLRTDNAMAKRKGTNDDLQSTTQKTKD
jgi:hypothetical protein